MLLPSRMAKNEPNYPLSDRLLAPTLAKPAYQRRPKLP